MPKRTIILLDEKTVDLASDYSIDINVAVELFLKKWQQSVLNRG
jgi:hypothetical protein